jgi:exosortase/archaeosortase family protein
MKALMNLLGYHISSDVQVITIFRANGETIRAMVSGACAGPATMAVFIGLFALMMLDTPLPARKAPWIFVAGIFGTWLQSSIRLVILMLVANYLGESAMWTAHRWTIYILFPLWYLAFAYIYFRQVGRATQKSKINPVSSTRQNQS